MLKTLIARTDPTGKCNVAREELRTLFDYCVGNIPNTPNKFTSMLKHHRIHLEPVWIDGRSVRGMRVVWKDVNAFASYNINHLGTTPAAKKTKSKGATV